MIRLHVHSPHYCTNKIYQDTRENPYMNFKWNNLFPRQDFCQEDLYLIKHLINLYMLGLLLTKYPITFDLSRFLFARYLVTLDLS